MGRASSIRRHRILALSLAAAVGTLAFASSPVFATTEAGDGSAAARSRGPGPVQDVAAGEAYTKFIVDYKESRGQRHTERPRQRLGQGGQDHRA